MRFRKDGLRVRVLSWLLAPLLLNPVLPGRPLLHQAPLRGEPTCGRRWRAVLGRLRPQLIFESAGGALASVRGGVAILDCMDWLANLVIVDTGQLPRARRRNAARKADAAYYTCVNCDRCFASRGYRTPYCSVACHDQAKAVRYFRRRTAQYGKHLPEDIRDAIAIKLAHAVSGGYDEASRRLHPLQRRQVFDRDQDQCVLCGAPAVQIDHIAGPDNHPENLRAVCDPCHRKQTRLHMSPISPGSEADSLLAELRQRALSGKPLRPCDADDWANNWRAWVDAHRSASF